MKNKIIIGIIFILFLVNTGFTKTTKSYSDIIAGIPATPFAAALAGAHTAFANDINSLYLNPSAIAGIEHSGIIFANSKLYEGIYLNYFGFVYNKIKILNENISIGLDFTLLNTDEIERTYIINNNGLANPAAGGYYKNTDKMLGLYYAGIIENFKFGLGVKYLNSKLADKTADAVRGVVALQKSFLDEKLWWGVVVKNFGGKLTYVSKAEEASTRFISGFGYKHNFKISELKIEVDAEYIKSDKINYYGSIDFMPLPVFNLRVGYDSKNDANKNNFNLGCGINFLSNKNKILVFDYAFIPNSDLGNSHRFALTFNWGYKKE
ncbi:MAG TPA: PorV/PorQ family protein [bacterium]|nr:PorV/PorQ family protein [bacterium]HOL47389.1 PorV/PorQ family protein [bacterium]HPQ18112.1 PorV/PorQ family protein [bacterium]